MLDKRPKHLMTHSELQSNPDKWRYCITIFHTMECLNDNICWHLKTFSSSMFVMTIKVSTYFGLWLSSINLESNNWNITTLIVCQVDVFLLLWKSNLRSAKSIEVTTITLFGSAASGMTIECEIVMNALLGLIIWTQYRGREVNRRN